MVVIESIEVREVLRFLFYLDIVNKLLLLQCKHSKYMYARCLNFPCFIKYLAAYMHAFCMSYLYVSLGKFLARNVSTCKILTWITLTCKNLARSPFFGKFCMIVGKIVLFSIKACSERYLLASNINKDETFLI